jgi:protoheme IX farnesyltransferase
MFTEYYRLAKPGIIYGNALAATAGFFVASLFVTSPDWWLLLAMLAGLSLIIACGCVLNNYMDREMDARMERTKNRAMVRGRISPRQALLFALALGVAGIAILFVFTTPLALIVALAGLVVYVGLYTPLKPRSSWALYVGAVAGAVPPVVGYTAVTGILDWYALAFFGVLYIWQLPHFIAIAMFRYDEYKAAGVPLVVRSSPSDAAKRRARSIFRYSLVVLLLLCLAPMLHMWMR